MYNHQEIEKKWQKYWAENNTFKSSNTSLKPKYYVLDMFPYPSGAGLHVGHPEGYTANDIVARYKHAKGHNVLHPMGWDAFGLPAENYAIKTGTHPRITTDENIATFKRQIQELGFSYDWDREIDTTDPKYFQWTQWIFLKMFEAGLAYEQDLPINYCPSCKTGLANEEVLGDFSCERCGTQVEKRKIRQWVLAITKYAERLLKDVDDLDWPEGIKDMQRNWIGKSEGCEFELKQAQKKGELPLFKNEGGLNCPAKLSLARSIFGSAPKVKKKNNIIYEIDAIIENDQKRIILRSKNIFKHFTSKSTTEFYKRKNLLSTLVEVLSDIEFVDNIGYFIVDSTVVKVVIGKQSNGRFFVKTYYVADTLTKQYCSTQTSKQVIPSIRVYTTRVDTVFGMTYAVIAPDHPSVQDFIADENRADCEAYIDKANKQSDQDRTADDKEKTGVFTGSYVLNPYNGEQVPLWIADYVLGSYGTGAVMAVPAHDERDFEFAKKYDLDIRQSIEIQKEEFTGEFATTDYGVLVKSGEFDGLSSEEAKEKLTALAEQKGFGHKKVNYKLRDWLFSRQRYWGEPIPLIHLERDSVRALPRITSLNDEMQSGKAYVLKAEPLPNPPLQGEGTDAASSLLAGENGERCETDARTLCSKGQEKSLVIDGKIISKIYSGIYTDIICDYRLPLELPEVEEYQPAGDGNSPLTNVESFVNVDLADNLSGKRETNTMPQWGGSCWYYLRFMDAKNPDALVGSQLEKYWGNVDSYVGGAEHAVLHLLYARFWHKFLFDIGVVSTQEPFYRLRNQGMILGMSYRNSKGKLIADDLVETDGTGTKFIDKETGEELEKIPAKMSKSLKNVINPDDIVQQYGADTLRMYEMYMADFKDAAPWDPSSIVGVRRFLDRFYRMICRDAISCVSTQEDEKKMKMLHKTIKKVQTDIENYKFNTAIAQMMILLNTGEPQDAAKNIEWKKAFIQLLHPFAPHMAEESWEILEQTEECYEKIYFATNNASKIERADKLLKSLNPNATIEQYSNIIEVEENGKTPAECAIQKLEVYKGKDIDAPIAVADTAVYFENAEFEFEPTKVKRTALELAGKKESDLSVEEVAELMIDFYQTKAREAGGKLDYYYIDSWAVLYPNGEIKTFEYRREYTLTDDRQGELKPYFPMAHLYVSKYTGKRHHESTDEDFFVEFAGQKEAFAELFGYQGNSIFFTAWPEYEQDMTVDNEITIGVQVLGKLRGEITIAKDEDKDSVLEKAKSNPDVAKWLEGKNVVKEIYVPGKIVNLVVK